MSKSPMKEGMGIFYYLGFVEENKVYAGTRTLVLPYRRANLSDNLMV